MHGLIPWVTDWVISLCVGGHSMPVLVRTCAVYENTIMDMLSRSNTHLYLDIPLSSMPVADDVSVIPSRSLFSHHLSGQMGQLLHE